MIAINQEDTIEIIQYLEQYPNCLSEMVYLFPILEHEFPDGDIIICMNHDPECYDPFIKMDVQLKEYPDGVMDTIDKIRESHHRKFRPDRNSGYVFLTTSFRKKFQKEILVKGI